MSDETIFGMPLIESSELPQTKEGNIVFGQFTNEDAKRVLGVNEIAIESIKLERSQIGFSRRFVIVSVQVGGKWFEIIRDLETSSNWHEVTAAGLSHIMATAEKQK